MKKIIFGFILISVLSIASYKITFALFSGTAQSTNNTFAAAQVFPSATPTPTPTTTPVNPGDVVINEVFAGGTSTTEWVELYNKTSSPIDVSGWTIADNTASEILPTVSPIPAEGFAVIVAPGSTAVVPGSAIKITLSGAIGGGLATNGDRLSLSKPDTTIIDSVNWGADTTFFTPSAASPTTTASIARNPNAVDTNSATDWIIDTTPSIGVVN